jgi:cation:H+ antiporter
VFAWYLWSSFKSDSGDETEEGEEIKTRNIPVSVLMIAGGLGALVFGGRLFVNSATALAQMFGVSDKFIAITVMAAGTSMPELATCVVAALKGRGQLALGNILGSNIGNILLILGGSALIHPLSFSGMTIVDIIAVAICPVFIYSCAFLFRKKEVDRAEGIIFLLTEAAYMWYLIANL